MAVLREKYASEDKLMQVAIEEIENSKSELKILKDNIKTTEHAKRTLTRQMNSSIREGKIECGVHRLHVFGVRLQQQQLLLF